MCIYVVGGCSYTFMVHHRALCVKISDVPHVVDFPPAANHPAFGTECSQNLTGVCVFTIHN